ncbi:TRAP transporter small permease [Mesorhizobium sp. AaZ16]|uniref:TRAP transporter small permease n=1 Tax=Mesorhizobium sp. AaZ16 TaxID=3402289 RepID=UPI00374E9322
MSRIAAPGAGSKALETVALACRTAAILFLALMSVLVVAQVIGRNIFDLGMPWADELARMSGIALVFLCVPLLALRGQHVAVDMMPMLLPPRARRAFLFAAEVMVLAFCALTLYGLQAFLLRAGKFATPSMGISNWFVYTPAVIGFALLAAATLLRLATLLRGEEPPRPEISAL